VVNNYWIGNPATDASRYIQAVRAANEAEPTQG